MTRKMHYQHMLLHEGDQQYYPVVDRRRFLATGLLGGCAFIGLASGTATAWVAHAADHYPDGGPQAMSMGGSLQFLRRFSGHQAPVRSLAWSPDGQMLASGSDDVSLILWQADGTILSHIAHPAAVTGLCWSPDGTIVATGAGTTLSFLQATTGQMLAQHQDHQGAITALTWLAKMPRLISVGLDTRAVVWETSHYRPLRVFRKHTTPIEAVASSHEVIASASRGGVIRIWQEHAQELHGLYQDTQKAFHCLAFSPQGELAAGGDDGMIRLWPTASVCQQSALIEGEQRCVDEPQRWQASATPLRSLAWSPDGRYLATGNDDGILSIWQMRSFSRRLVAQEKHAYPLNASAWSPNKHLLAVASGQLIYLWQWSS
ncbi:WD40 repeat domain-containing protein [Ktedonospora formicarum]|uniref:Anaphase-promoting complex subunit 4-like WD40 domain-containing protein n=1 Tax=Ktedonospora formicarum TaxID=2778364 RepID=A0A8J3MW56_9CHLR|nr:WD40 repeat domain-containing protein [Ktedonospora formicarum]GHO48343.1 hypothetical protein KSX_65060 [Ktedonospora formicarum]